LTERAGDVRIAVKTMERRGSGGVGGTGADRERGRRLRAPRGATVAEVVREVVGREGARAPA